MEVILLQKVANLGNIGDRVKVRSGFGRNFLLPQGKATLATPDNIARFEARRAELERTAREHLTSAEERSAAMKDFRLTLHAKAGTEGKLFGSIGTSDIAEELTRAGFQVERSEVRLPHGPLRSTWKPAPVRCSAMSLVPIEPKSFPSVPALACMVSLKSFIAAARSSAEDRCSRARPSSSARRASKRAMFSGVASVALPCGKRKLRPKPERTFTRSPMLPRLATFCSRMTSIAVGP